MIDVCRKSPYLVASATLVWLSLAVTGFFSYAGSSLTYIAFSLIFLFLLIDGIFNRVSFGYAFLVVFLWLGFWLKLVVHLCLNYAYLEPVGYFDGNTKSWDAVLTVSTVGAMAVILAKVLFSKYVVKRLDSIEFGSKVPFWYLSARKWLWGGVWVAIILLPIINVTFGISQVGIVPSLILPWHLNALVIWLMGFGLAALIFTLVHWDHTLKQGWVMGGGGVLAEAFFSSLSSISRAMYIFKTLPYLIVLFARRFSVSQERKRAKWLVLTMWLCLLVVNLVLVMVLRYSENSPIDASSNRSQLAIVKDSSSFSSFVEQISNRVAHLVVDRWIGLEGVMAVVAYPEKNFDLFANALREKREIGKVDFYTAEIGRAGITDADAVKFQYASLPGGMAFFYFAGTLWGVLAGMIFLTFLLLVSEFAVKFLTQNPYLCSLWGMGIAQIVASFGTGTRQMATYVATCFAAMILIWVVQTLSTSQKVGEE